MDFRHRAPPSFYSTRRLDTIGSLFLLAFFRCFSLFSAVFLLAFYSCGEVTTVDFPLLEAIPKSYVVST